MGSLPIFAHDLRVIPQLMEENTMKMLTSAVLALALAAGPVLAQTAPKAPTTPSAPAATMDSATEAKFKAADKDNNGVLEGAELNTYKADLAKIDTNKDGKVSRDEFAAAGKSGVIK